MKFMKHKEKDFEIWLPIKNFPDFKISNWGRLYNKKTNRYLSGRPNTNGYWQVRLRNKDGYKDVLIHRLVGEYFVPNLVMGTQINHKDQNKNNNRWSNLEWCDPKDNINYGTRSIRAAETYKRNRNFIICQYDLDGNLIAEYNTPKDAALAVGGRTDSIRWALDGKLKTTYGFVWRRRLKEQQS